MNLFKSLTDLGRDIGSVALTEEIKRGYTLDLHTGELWPITTPITVPLRIPKRGSAAKSKPNFGYDSARYALSKNGLFLQHCLELAKTAKDRIAIQALEAYIANPVSSRKDLHELTGGALPTKPIMVGGKAVKMEDWVVLVLKGETLAMRPKLFALYQSRAADALQDGPEGYCLVTGKKAPIARLHPPITFGSKGGSISNLFSVNEGATQHFGDKQGFNFPVSVETAQLYTSALNRQFEHGAFLTDTGVIVSWPEGMAHHPVIPIIKSLLYRWHKNDQVEAIEELWKDLVLLTDLDTRINVAALVHKMARISVRHYRTLTVRELQHNLLEFRLRFRGVSTLLTLPRIIPYGEGKDDGKFVSISDLGFVDTVWSILTGEAFPAHLQHTVRLNLSREQRAQLMHRWLELLSGLPLPKETKVTDLDERYDEPREHFRRGKADEQTLLDKRLQLCDQFIRPDLKNAAGYQWGRFVAICCFSRIYYHALRGKNDLPTPKHDVLEQARQNPQRFRASFKPLRYVEQMIQRGRKGSKVLAFEAVYNALQDQHPPSQFNLEQGDLVYLGFHNQFRGLQDCRFRATDVLLKELADEAEMPPPVRTNDHQP